MKTLPREPWRGSMICGEQLEYGVVPGRLVFCGERKADGLPMCEEHYQDVLDEYGEVRMAPGNAVGAPQWALRLLWEPMEGDEPIEPSYDEMVLYVGVQTPGGE